MEADPLYHVKQLFYQASYKACISEASSQPLTPSDDDDPLALQRALYVARSHLALSPPSVADATAVLAPFTSLDPAPLAARAVAAFAEYLASPSTEGVEAVRDLLLEAEGEEGEGTVRVIAGSVFVLEKENEEAVATLTEGTAKEDLECMAILVQLLLSLDRRDLAHATYASAKKIGNDSMLVQAMEAWIGLKAGARPLHQAYYYFEELYQLPAGRTGPVLASHAAAHLLLSHVDEAKADILEAQQGSYAEDVNVLAVGTALNMDGYADKLATTAPSHPLSLDLADRAKAFDEAAAKFAITATT